jgi:hypothetical protein
VTRWPADWRVDAPGVACPTCGEQAGRPILWGMPGFDVIAAQEAGEIDIEIGGCVVFEDDPTHRCTSCGAGFRRGAPGLRHRTQQAGGDAR